MSRYVRPLKGATRVRSCRYLMPDKRTAELTLYDGMSSDGYKTNYQHRPVRWLEVYADPFPGETRRVHNCWRYAGIRWDKAEKDWQKIVRDLLEAGSTLENP